MTEVEDLLTRYNVDSQNSRLRDYYEADNLWRTLRIERDENRHSAFYLANFFGQKDPKAKAEEERLKREAAEAERKREVVEEQKCKSKRKSLL